MMSSLPICNYSRKCAMQGQCLDIPSLLQCLDVSNRKIKAKEGRHWPLQGDREKNEKFFLFPLAHLLCPPPIKIK